MEQDLEWMYNELWVSSFFGMFVFGFGLFLYSEMKIREIDRKIAENDYEDLGDTSTLAEPGVVDDLISNRVQ